MGASGGAGTADHSRAHHNWNVILVLLSSTVICREEFSCWLKSYSNKATLVVGWSHRCKISTAVIINW